MDNRAINEIHESKTIAAKPLMFMELSGGEESSGNGKIGDVENGFCESQNKSSDRIILVNCQNYKTQQRSGSDVQHTTVVSGNLSYTAQSGSRNQMTFTISGTPTMSIDDSVYYPEFNLQVSLSIGENDATTLMFDGKVDAIVFQNELIEH